jgi:hypothetical protein
MEKANLFWAILWTVMFVLSVVAIFWNPSHLFTMAVSALFAGMFWYDYRKTKGL